MRKLTGSCLILAGGVLIWLFQSRERRRRREVLSDLLTALRQLGEAIRMTRTPLPRLLEALASDCGPDAAALLRTSARAAERGEDLGTLWRAGVERLPLEERDKALLRSLDLRGDEEHICKGISLVTYALAERLALLERRRSEEDKRGAALCFSGAALLVILLL